MANPAQTVTVETLPVVTHQNVRCITTDLLAQLYGTKPTNISTNFLSNVDRFVSGKHFFKLEGAALREFKNLHKSSETAFVGISPRAKHLTLWTERGAARHAKMLDTDQAWEVFEKLEDAYFGVSEDRQTETLFPSEQQTLSEIVHSKVRDLPPEQQGKALAEAWSRLHRKFRIAKYSQLPPDTVAALDRLATLHGSRTAAMIEALKDC